MNKKEDGGLKDASSFGYKIIKDRSVDMYAGEVLFPVKLSNATNIISKLRWEKK